MGNKVIAGYALTAFNAIEILEIDGEYIKFRWNNGGDITRPKWGKVKQDKHGRDFFTTYKIRIFLDECMRTNI